MTINLTNGYRIEIDDMNLTDDPFTNAPCTPEEYAKNSLEYDRQVMLERYGHYDGLE